MSTVRQSVPTVTSATLSSATVNACRWLGAATRRRPTVTSGSPRSSAQMTNREQEERGNLDATGGAGAATADEHQRDDQGIALLAQRRHVDHIETAGAAERDLAERGEHLAGGVVGADGERVGPLGGEQADEAGGQQHHAAPDGQLGGHRPAGRATPLPERLEQGGEAQPADDRAEGQRQRHPRVAGEGDQTLGVEAETAVVERLDRVEHPGPQRPARGVVVGQPEPPGDQGGHHQFAAEHRAGDAHQQAADVADAVVGGLGLHQQPVAQPELAGDGQADQGRAGEDAEAAGLGEHGDHHQPEPVPVVRGVGDVHAGHRDRRGGGEERGDQRGVAVRAGRPGQHQQAGADRDRHQETERHQPDGVTKEPAHQTILSITAGSGR